MGLRNNGVRRINVLSLQFMPAEKFVETYEKACRGEVVLVSIYDDFDDMVEHRSPRLERFIREHLDDRISLLMRRMRALAPRWRAENNKSDKKETNEKVLERI